MLSNKLYVVCLGNRQHQQWSTQKGLLALEPSTVMMACRLYYCNQRKERIFDCWPYLDGGDKAELSDMAQGSVAAPAGQPNLHVPS